MNKFVDQERRSRRPRRITFSSLFPASSVLVTEDVEKAAKIAGLLYDQFSRKTGFFEGYEPLEYIMCPIGVKQDSNQLALYLTYVIATVDYQTNLDRLLEQARVEYERNPEMFTPEGVIKAYPNVLTRFVEDLGSKHSGNGAWIWKKISEILLREYQGTPLNLTEEPVTVNALRQKIGKFPHLRQRKISNFYIRLMFEKGFFKIVDPENIPVVPDIQVARISFYTGILKIIKKDGANQHVGSVGSDPIRSHIEHVWTEAAKPLGIPAAYLDEALWTIGSMLCSSKRCPGCPIDALCDKNTSITFSEEDTNR